MMQAEVGDDAGTQDDDDPCGADDDDDYGGGGGGSGMRGVDFNLTSGDGTMRLDSQTSMFDGTMLTGDNLLAPPRKVRLRHFIQNMDFRWGYNLTNDVGGIPLR